MPCQIFIRLTFFLSRGYRIFRRVDIFWNRANSILGPQFTYDRAERHVEKEGEKEGWIFFQTSLS